jgi:hypothetical protein
MEIISKIMTGLGAVGVLIGLISIWTGYLDFSSGMKNDQPSQQDKGGKAIALGALMVVMSGGIAASIVATINALPH